MDLGLIQLRLFKTEISKVQATVSEIPTMVNSYLHELKRSSPYPTKLLVFDAGEHLKQAEQPATENRSLTGSGLFWPYCRAYCAVSSIHGVRYLTDEAKQYFEKVIWLLILLATTCCTIYVYIELAGLYHTQRIQTTVMDTAHPVFFIAFPSIAICPRNRVNWPKLQEAHQLFLPSNASAETVDNFRRFFEVLEDFRFGKFIHLGKLFTVELESSELQLALLDNVNVLEVMEYLSFTCDEMFVEPCWWRYKTYNCCDLFFLERTEYGFCHVFNSLVGTAAQKKEHKERYYPYHNSKAGESSGLEVTVKLDEAKMRPGFRSTNGLHVMVKQPEEWHQDVRFINYNTFTKIPITPQLTKTDEHTRSVTSIERRCLFEDEHHYPLYKKIPGLLYLRGNCITRCHQEHILKYCRCNLSLLFPQAPSDNFTECKAKDFKCIYEHEDIFSTEHHESESEFVDDVGNDSMICNCLNSCNQLRFINYFNSVPLEGVNATETTKQVHLDIHYNSPNMLKYSTHMRFSFVELLGSFGGVIGLFLGGSLLSAVELVYYFSIGLYIYWQKQRPNSGNISAVTLDKFHRNKFKVVKVKSYNVKVKSPTKLNSKLTKAKANCLKKY